MRIGISAFALVLTAACSAPAVESSGSNADDMPTMGAEDSDEAQADTSQPSDAVTIVTDGGLESPYACSLGVNAAPDLWDVSPDERVLRNELGMVASQQWVPAIKQSRFAAQFTEMWTDHEPCYRIVGNFTDIADADAIIALAPTRIRPYIELQKSKFEAAGWDAQQDYLIEVLKPFEFAWTAGYSVEHDIIEVKVPSPEWKAKVEAAIAPDRRGYFDVQVGAVPTILG